MRKSGMLCTVVYVAAVLVGTMRAALPNPTDPPAASPIGRWYWSLPGWGCYSPPFPAGYQVRVPIGPEVDAFLGGGQSQFTDAPLDAEFTRVGAIYDPAHRVGLFNEHGQDRGSYLLIANVGAPPVAVKEKDLSALAMGGKVHLGDTVEKVRAAFSAPSAFHLTTMSGCAFPHAAAYSAAIFYGPPHHPPATDQICKDIGPDIKREQVLGYVIFHANRVAVLVWNRINCAI